MELTEEKKAQAKELLADVEKNNGHLSIAHSLGLTRIQVVEIHQELMTEIAEAQEPMEG